ncbi:MAG TPA: hypothetical protein VES02_05915 [Dermatophilaceae bacterium]|nr:hypothetical protein [Dermatophilaceae bacterium]
MTNASPASTARPTRQAGRRLPERSSVVAATVIAWLGLLVHNVAELPDQTLLSPETLWPSLVSAALLVLYAAGPVGLAGIGLVGWALLNLVGGTLSVLPLPVLPFEPEQTLRHYSFHLLYAATQVPVLVVSYRLVVGPRCASIARGRCRRHVAARTILRGAQPQHCGGPAPQ